MSTNLNFRKSAVLPNGEQMSIEINLHKVGGNKSAYFSITGTVWEPKKPKIDRYMIHGGAIGDEIVKHFPEFEIFNRLHLSGENGEPMHPIDNGYYWLQNNIETAKSYLRVSDSEMDILKTAADKMQFAYMLVSMGIPDRWFNESRHAIKLLETLTGESFEPSNDAPYKPMQDEQMADIAAKIEDGYYNPDKVKERAKTAADKFKSDMIKAAKDDYNQTVRNAKIRRDLHIALCAHGKFPNVIHYSHTDTVTFNWNETSPMLPADEIERVSKLMSAKYDSLKFKDARKGKPAAVKA